MWSWLVVSNIFYFPFHIWDVILSIDELIFFKMVIAPPTRESTFRKDEEFASGHDASPRIRLRTDVVADDPPIGAHWEWLNHPRHGCFLILPTC
jgi:hypothetical protein